MSNLRMKQAGIVINVGDGSAVPVPARNLAIWFGVIEPGGRSRYCSV